MQPEAMIPPLGALAALEDLALVPRAHVVALNCNFGFLGFTDLFMHALKHTRR